MNTNRCDPLVRLGQGDYTRDIDPPTPARHRDGRLDLGRILTREPAETYHARRGECLTSLHVHESEFGESLFAGLTFEVTYPDRCNLKDQGYDAVARKYLTKWGIASG